MKKTLVLLALVSAVSSEAQNVAINSTGAAPVTSAMLDIASTTSGLLIPRMNTAQRTAIAAPATSVLVFDTSLNAFYYYDGTTWVPLLSSSSGWMLAGNTLAGTELMGSVNAQPVRFFSNNTERVRITSAGYFGFYTTTPATWIHFVPTVANGQFQTQWDNNLTGDACARFQHTSTANGNRVVLGVTNYNASAFQSPGIMGLALSTGGSGAIGVQGTCNGTSQIGVYAGNQNSTAATITGWGLYCNNWAGGVTAWQNVSDRRLKKDIKTITNATDKIKQLRGVEYYFDLAKYSDINLPENKQYGFIAQEVEEVIPEIVRESMIPGNQSQKAEAGMSSEYKSYNFKTLSYTNIIPLLVEALKEQDQRIIKLEAEIENLKRQSGKSK